MGQMWAEDIPRWSKANPRRRGLSVQLEDRTANISWWKIIVFALIAGIASGATKAAIDGPSGCTVTPGNGQVTIECEDNP